VDETRNDAIKVMIAGPEGTPYAGGLFEFDCFIPLQYPNTPPLMNLCTTAGGQVRFNPNLYADGKVCLSLLGTWPGQPEEQWSSTSTLLQVLISIQSMIFVDAPMYNEPGYRTPVLTDSRSIAYNKNVMLQNVRWAMVDWMKDEHRGGIWADVIKSHFTIHQECIRKRIQAWMKNDSRFRSYSNSTMSSCGTSEGGGARGQRYHGGLEMDLLQAFDEGCKIIERWEYTCDLSD